MRILSPSPTRLTRCVDAFSASASRLVRNCSSTELRPEPTTATAPAAGFKSSAAALTAMSSALSAPLTRIAVKPIGGAHRLVEIARAVGQPRVVHLVVPRGVMR